MATTIAAYYTDELVEWKRLIAFYNSEMDELELKLAEVIQRNTIPNIAFKVEGQQDKLNIVSEKFYQLQLQIQQQETALKTNSTYIENSAINTETEKRQNGLRRSMQQAEREYVDIKYDCYNFLSGTLKK
jgi:hypothetical protein